MEELAEQGNLEGSLSLRAIASMQVEKTMRLSEADPQDQESTDVVCMHKVTIHTTSADSDEVLESELLLLYVSMFRNGAVVGTHLHESEVLLSDECHDAIGRLLHEHYRVNELPGLIVLDSKPLHDAFRQQKKLELSDNVFASVGSTTTVQVADTESRRDRKTHV